MSNNIHPELYDLEFIAIINNLNESIKEYYKVSKHNIKETINFLSLFEQKWNLLENLNNETPNLPNHSEKIVQEMNKLEEIINELKKNSGSSDINLNLFFNDAKILFKKLRLKRNENLKNFHRSISNRKKNNILNINNISEKKRINRFDDFYSNNNLSKSEILKMVNTKKIIYYLNQLKDFNEIIGKFSVKAKFNFINFTIIIITFFNNSIRLNNSINYINKFLGIFLRNISNSYSS